MGNPARLSDFEHPTIANLACGLTHGKEAPLEKVECIFNYVRDEIKFGFPPRWDEVKASQSIYYHRGYCNTKAILFVALCRAAGIPARVHFSLADMRLMHGILPAFSFSFVPKLGVHSWTEVQLDGQWKAIDSYIDDKILYERASKRLKASGRELGYSVSFKEGKSCCEFNFGEIGFVHMGAVREDLGTWEDSADYYASDRYPRFNSFQKLALPMLIKLSNRNIARLRQSPA